jgi:hypothetical protein
MSVQLIGNDGVPVEFGINELRRIPYATDILDLESVDSEQLPVTGHDHTDLLKVKQMLELQSTCGVAFKVPPIRRNLFDVEVFEPAFVRNDDPWEGTTAPYKSVLNSYTAAELLALLKCASFLQCNDLVYAPAYILLQRERDYDAEARAVLRSMDRTFHYELLRRIKTEDYVVPDVTATTGGAGASASASASATA